MKNKFTPISVINKRPVWRTPDFNPSVFTPISVIPMSNVMALVRQIYNK